MKKISLFFTLFFAAFAVAQTPLVHYPFEGNATVSGVPIGSPALEMIPATSSTSFTYTSAVNGNPRQALTTTVNNQSPERYLKLQISTADYNSIRISFDHWTNTRNGKLTWTVYANTTGAMYTSRDRIGAASCT